jgi:hypothetical protein
MWSLIFREQLDVNLYEDDCPSRNRGFYCISPRTMKLLDNISNMRVKILVLRRW